MLHRPRHPDAGTVTEGMIDESGGVSTRSLYSDCTVRPHVPIQYTPSIQLPKTVVHDLTCSDTSGDDDGDGVSMLEEINSLRKDNASLRQRLVCTPVFKSFTVLTRILGP